jgi:hypothetical protein
MINRRAAWLAEEGIYFPSNCWPQTIFSRFLKKFILNNISLNNSFVYLTAASFNYENKKWTKWYSKSTFGISFQVR